MASNRNDTSTTGKNDGVNTQPGRERQDGRQEGDLDGDRTSERMAAQRDANRQAAEADVQGEEQIDQGSQAREGMGQARQSDGS